MPIYEYKCQKCNSEFELLLYGSDVPKCPKCNSLDLEKKISLFGFSVKGSNGSTSSSSNSSSGCSSCSMNNCSSCSTK